MTEERSAWSPLKNSLFRSLWIATIVSNIGTWMQDVGAGWLMTSLTSSPSKVALVKAADTLSIDAAGAAGRSARRHRRSQHWLADRET
jgi:hypothetical protein